MKNTLQIFINLFCLSLIFIKGIVCARCRVWIPLSIFLFLTIQKITSQDVGAGGSLANPSTMKDNPLRITPLFDFTVEKALMAEKVLILGNFDYLNEKYAFPEGDTVFAWIKFISISAQYQMIFEWYTPTGNLYYNFTSVSSAPGPALWAKLDIPSPLYEWFMACRLQNKRCRNRSYNNYHLQKLYNNLQLRGFNSTYCRFNHTTLLYQSNG